MDYVSDQDLIDAWKLQDAPLLPLLHAFHDRDGFLSEGSIRAVALALKIPLADLYGTITFYHHFLRSASDTGVSKVCTGPVCRYYGGLELLQSLGDRGQPMPCAGRCDVPVPVIRAGALLTGTSADNLHAQRSPLPVPNPGGLEECVFGSIRLPRRASFQGYRESGGYEALSKALQSLQPADVIEIINESGLAGRGGAGYPTGWKWQAVAKAEGGPKTIVCNADEGEPGCFKDRVVLDHDPHAILEGMVLAGYATGASRGFIYLRYEYPETLRILETAISEAVEAKRLGQNILGSEFSFDIHVRRGAGAYICGEETSLLNSLEGKHPFPRNRPPFPVTHGYNNLPTAVNNVETLASIAPIIRHGAKWYADLGLGVHKGTKLISLSGDIQRPGNYEVPLGFPLETLLYHWAGGPVDGQTIQAVTMAGLSGGFLAGDDLSVTLDEPSIRACGSFLGAGGIMVFDSRRDMVEVAHTAMSFFAEESCGKCFPCRIGTQRLSERLAGSAGPDSVEAWKDEVGDLGDTMKELSACGLGVAAPLVTDSLIRYFPDQVERHVRKSR